MSRYSTERRTDVLGKGIIPRRDESGIGGVGNKDLGRIITSFRLMGLFASHPLLDCREVVKKDRNTGKEVKKIEVRGVRTIRGIGDLFETTTKVNAWNKSLGVFDTRTDVNELWNMFNKGGCTKEYPLDKAWMIHPSLLMGVVNGEEHTHSGLINRNGR